MLELVEATRFDKAMTAGKTKPVLLTCERSNGEEVEVVAKFSYGCDKCPDALIREAVGAMLAHDLGLPVPEPVIVRASAQFIDSLPPGEVADYLRQSIPLGFGSAKLPDGFSTWAPGSGAVPEGLRAMALEILAFDCMISNGDRRVDNPNLQYNGSSFAIFDHEMGFMTSLNLGWQQPWLPESLGGWNSPQQHVFYGSFKGKTDLQIASAMFTRLSELTDNRIGGYGFAIPEEWHGTNGALDRALQLVTGLRDNALATYTELLRALA